MLGKDKNFFFVKDLMLTLDKFPCVNSRPILTEALDKRTTLKLGICCVVDNEKLSGIITDGDLRRKILEVQKPISSFLIDDVIFHAIKNPISINVNENINNAVCVMEKNLIWDLPVIDENKKLLGLLHLHPVVKKLLVI